MMAERRAMARVSSLRPPTHRGPPRPTSKLDAARVRLREIVILRMKTGIPEETRRGLREAEAWWRGEVRLHFQVLERFRERLRRGTRRIYRSITTCSFQACSC
jgi:hypothetical protein